MMCCLLTFLGKLNRHVLLITLKYPLIHTVVQYPLIYTVVQLLPIVLIRVNAKYSNTVTFRQEDER
jgi:hypothetical protein